MDEEELALIKKRSATLNKDYKLLGVTLRPGKRKPKKRKIKRIKQ